MDNQPIRRVVVDSDEQLRLLRYLEQHAKNGGREGDEALHLLQMFAPSDVRDVGPQPVSPVAGSHHLPHRIQYEDRFRMWPNKREWGLAIRCSIAAIGILFIVGTVYFLLMYALPVVILMVIIFGIIAFGASMVSKGKKAAANE